MTKEQLQALNLTDEQINAIIEDYGKNYVSKAQFNEKTMHINKPNKKLKT